ncbi:hypothetical protein BUALT_Bualt14G0005600 [Buddleja alternifolia]|uniref:WAT1-related protein n=1 Tax=Buddleja alternifolia TaxID=168488 RepID=A0AAV6WH44_9LAMI|nr:hypothetical protein BUALT_Bualt14G0005600 [Buddleja alternifolia]
MKSFSKWYPVIALIVIDLYFAINNILLKKLLSDGVNRLVFITYRQSIASIFLFPLAYFLERRSRPNTTLTILCYLFLSAIIGSTLFQYLCLLGIEYTSATFASGFLNMVPVMTFYLESVNIKYNSGRVKVVGALVCIGGTTLLLVYKGMPLFQFTDTQQQFTKLSSTKKWKIGSVALFVGNMCWSFWYILQAKIGKIYPCPYSSTAIMAFFSTIQAAILSFSIHRDLSIWILNGKADILIILYGGIGTGLSFVGMSWCVKKKGPFFTAAFSPLVQIMVAMFDVPILHEQLHLGSLIGSIVVIVGLYLVLWAKDREAKRQEQELVQQIEEVKDQEPDKDMPTPHVLNQRVSI